MTWTPDICIYHYPCDDGFASAWVVNQRWPGHVTFVEANYGQEFPLEPEDMRSKNILIADFSFKPDVLKKMMETARSVVVLDHHKTAQADLAEFNVETCGSAKFTYSNVEGVLDDLAELDRDKLVAHFDMERSGASMTWDFCFPDRPRPELIKYIEDRDLWRMQYPETRAISLYLRAHEHTFGIWDAIAEKTEFSMRMVLDEARAIEMFYDKKIAEIADTFVLKKIGLHDNVPVVYAPYAFASDVAHELLQRHAEAPFAAVVVDAYGGRTYSLRSEDSRVDVSEVAKSFGGGGHRNAAGFRIPV